MCVAVPLAPLWALAPLVAVRGLAGGATRPLLSALVAVELPADRRREGIALSRAVSNAGTVIGPPLGALLAAHHFSAVFVVDGATTLLLVWLIHRHVPEGGHRCRTAAPPATPGRCSPRCAATASSAGCCSPSSPSTRPTG